MPHVQHSRRYPVRLGGPGPAKVLRAARGRWSRPHGAGRRVLHAARAQRSRQDHLVAHGRRPAAARCRLDFRARHGRARRPGRRQAGHGLGFRRADDLRQAHAVRISRIRRRPVGHRGRRRAGARTRPDRLAESRAARPSTLRRLLQGHAPEGGTRRRSGARAQGHHPRRALHRARCRLRPPGQDRAARARRGRPHRDHDDAHP